MPTLKPYRVVNEYDIINHFKWNPTGTYPAVKGTLVKILSGIMLDQNLQQLGDVGAHYTNIVSQRYGVQPSVAQVTNSGDLPLGILLYDVREVDENGERLIYHPDKAAKMQAVISGQAVPIATKGIFVWSGFEGAVPTAPGVLYAGNNGGFIASGQGSVLTNQATKCGTILGAADPNGFAYIKLDL